MGFEGRLLACGKLHIKKYLNDLESLSLVALNLDVIVVGRKLGGCL